MGESEGRFVLGIQYDILCEQASEPEAKPAIFSKSADRFKYIGVHTGVYT